MTCRDSGWDNIGNDILDDAKWRPGVLYLLRLRWEDGSSALKLGIAYETTYRDRRAKIASESGATVEVLDEWKAPRVLCNMVEQQHHRARKNALHGLRFIPAEPFGGSQELYVDTAEMLGDLRTSVRARLRTIPDGDTGPDLDPMELHAQHYDPEAV